jgi:2-oxoglutarate/2-oxoacid ferredoxin oxidoreductase subunit alpha
LGQWQETLNLLSNSVENKVLKVGMFRPISLYPFPTKRISELAGTTKKFLDIEMNMGQMLKDVKLAVNGKVPVEFFGKAVGQWLGVEEIVVEVERLKGEM